MWTVTKAWPDTLLAQFSSDLKPRWKQSGNTCCQGLRGCLSRCSARVFIKYYGFPPKVINFILCLFDLKSRWICPQSKQNMDTLGPWQRANPTQTRCLVERIGFLVVNGQDICSLNQWSPYFRKSLSWMNFKKRFNESPWRCTY